MSEILPGMPFNADQIVADVLSGNTITLNNGQEIVTLRPGGNGTIDIDITPINGKFRSESIDLITESALAGLDNELENL